MFSSFANEKHIINTNGSGVQGSPTSNELSAQSRTIVYASPRNGGGLVKAYTGKGWLGYGSDLIISAQLADREKLYTFPGGDLVNWTMYTVRLHFE